MKFINLLFFKIQSTIVIILFSIQIYNRYFEKKKIKQTIKNIVLL